MMAGRELDARIAKEVMGASCVHELVCKPIEVISSEVAAEWREEYGCECPVEHARGEARYSLDSDYPPQWCKHCHTERTMETAREFWSLPHYSTDIAAAWEVIMRFDADGFEWCVSDDEVYFVKGDPDKPGYQFGCCFPGKETTHLEAICLAALKAA